MVELVLFPLQVFTAFLFVVMKALGSRRPVIDLSTLNLRVLKSPFKMERFLKSVFLLVWSGDWMASQDLKDVYLHILIHPYSHKFRRYLVFNWVYQFKALCFGLSTAPQVFARITALVSPFLYRVGIRIRRYLDDWLSQAPSRALVIQVWTRLFSCVRT